MFLCAAVVSGRVYCLPAAAFVASFIVQTQMGYAVALAAVMLLSLLALAPRLRSWLGLARPLSGSLPKAMAITVVILAIVWTPTAIKQIMGMPGRVSETVRYFAAQGVGHSWQEAEKTLACAMAAFPASLVGVDLKRPQIIESFDGPYGASSGSSCCWRFRNWSSCRLPICLHGGAAAISTRRCVCWPPL